MFSAVSVGWMQSTSGIVTTPCLTQMEKDMSWIRNTKRSLRFNGGALIIGGIACAASCTVIGLLDHTFEIPMLGIPPSLVFVGCGVWFVRMSHRISDGRDEPKSVGQVTDGNER